MSAIKFSARIIALAAMALGLAASCGQLLGDYVVTVGESNLPNPPGPDAEAPPAKVCDVGVTACEGKVLQLCTDDGTAWAPLEVCGSPELCESSDVSTVSGCIPAACATDQMSCDDNLLRLCNVARNGWEVFDTCESAAHCDAGAKQCLPAPCEPGDRRCNVGNLEACNDTRTAWEQLDTCETNELCEATLAPPTTVGEVQSITDLPPPEVLSDPQGRPLECRGPVCVPKEVRCDEVVNPANLLVCNEGQTAFILAEECATPKLCEASITYTGLRGSPRCVRPTCAVGEHRCTETGGLEVCNVDRDGFNPIAQCIGAPFCNAVAADNGGLGCEDAPCDPGEQQCNGPQILVCSNDQTQFVANGAPCETRGLCNDDNPLAAFCQAPVCQRGPFSGTEFRCEGTSLLRCNDQHTAYDRINTCATAALCNPSLGSAGCQQPVCAPNETRCSGDFVQRCNADRTAFESTERCDPGTCDGTRGICADPCIQGNARCNAQGNLEECRNPLVGREITARCGSVQLCDANGRTCRQPPAGCTADGVRRCRQQGQNTVLEVCTDGRSRFATLDTCTPGEFCDPGDQQCDVCQQGSDPTCEGNANLATCAANGQTEGNQACGSGCLVQNGADRCLNCVLGQTRCEGRQLVVCRSRNGTEVVDREDCDTNQLCQATLASCTGENCRCEESQCDPGERRCNGAQPEICNAGQTGFQADGASCTLDQNCNRNTGRCFACAVGDVACNNGQLFGCAQDRSGFTQPLGTRRCTSDNAGDRSQSCDGSRLVDTRCQGGTPECFDGRCNECDPNDFDPVCDDAVETVCLGGELDDQPCGGVANCIEGACSGSGCTTVPRMEGADCTRQNGNPGHCDGLRQPTCVECTDVAHCDDRNDCTTDSCAISRACQHAARTGTCNVGGQAGFCNGTVCTPQRCTPRATTCSGALFQRCNGDGSAFVTEDTCASPALCNNNTGCAEPCDPAQCDDDNECTTDTCSTANACAFTPNGGTCNGGADVCSGRNCVDCLEGGGGCDNGEVCQGTTCVAPCGGASCDFGCDSDTNECNPCTPDGCGPVDTTSCFARVCRGGPSCVDGDRDGLTCGADFTGTCDGLTCDIPDPPEPEPPGDDDGNGNGGGEPPGPGGLCDGDCEDLLDEVLCPQDCP